MEENLIEAPDEYILALGKLVTNSARLEQYLNTLIGKIAGFNDLGDPTPFILVNHTAVSQKIDILSAMCEEQLPSYPHLKNYKEVMSEARSAIALRNKYVHNSFLFDPLEGRCLMMTASARGKLKLKYEYIGVENIEEASKKIKYVIVMLHNLILNTNHQSPN